MNFNRVMKSMALLCLLSSGCAGLTSKQTVSPNEFISVYPKGTSPMFGRVPLQRLLDQMRAQGVLKRPLPRTPVLSATVAVEIVPESSWETVAKQIELKTGWTWDDGSTGFIIPVATHHVDAPDEAGRALGTNLLPLAQRQMLSVGVRFVRLQASAAATEQAKSLTIGAGGQFIEFWQSTPAGVPFNRQSRSERSFEVNVRDLEGPTNNVVRTSRQVVPSGAFFSGMVGTLPGGLCRVDAQVEISSFIGNDAQSTDQASQLVPIQIDGARGKWLFVSSYTGADANIRLALAPFGLNVAGGGETVHVYVRVN